MIYYHITPAKNVESILIAGIIPGKRKGLSCNQPKWKSVFLTNDYNRIITDQAGLD